ncbi:ribonuclease HI [Clostridium sp. SYSU_GA19001]|uniref:ribonuclease HI n=1 Tax=Clostridium caldaquaticum TaxID=2940653 RepID=UPI0020770BCC|nr:ribonuclease HI [Clostridium caldaquaticum]MCM8711165.1 ribonuclease HI [Clostridium caldaquaticum]
MKSVTIYTDGACRGNGKENSIGAFGILFMYNGVKKEVKQAFRNTTNNIMELSAVIQALAMLKEPCNVKLYSDSAYVINAINQKWIDNWQKNGWKSSTKEPVKNKELWEKLIELMKYHKVEFIKVKGHSDNPYNNRCDELANEAMDELLNSNFNV